ncbi:DUF981 family protein [Herbiconiux sp. VKM Ac-2851]|nr:DUF981 family protein [Herbiconiux sp. VKM Ac-2851]
MPTYNTIMSVAAGAGLVSVVLFGRALSRGKTVSYEGQAVNFGVLGVILTVTGAHMTLTWPFAAYFPFDNIIFGEPSLAFGVLLLAAAFLLWRRAEQLRTSTDPVSELRAIAAPLTILIIGLGLSLLAIAAAGLVFQLFAAPPEEPISGLFAQWPWVEAIFMSGLFALTGLGAVLLPAAVRGLRSEGRPSAVQVVTGIALGMSGTVFVLFGALNFFTHIGLIVHTM